MPPALEKTFYFLVSSTTNQISSIMKQTSSTMIENCIHFPTNLANFYKHNLTHFLNVLIRPKNSFYFLLVCLPKNKSKLTHFLVPIIILNDLWKFNRAQCRPKQTIKSMSYECILPCLFSHAISM